MGGRCVPWRLAYSQIETLNFHWACRGSSAGESVSNFVVSKQSNFDPQSDWSHLGHSPVHSTGPSRMIMGLPFRDDERFWKPNYADRGYSFNS